MSLSPQPFSLRKVTEDVCRLLRPQAQDKGLQLAWACESDLVLLGDGSRLRQVLLNLIGNAVKFTATGGVGVRARTWPCAGGAGLEIEVEDTGIGMSADACERLFNRFVQVDGSITRRFGGTGLGLAISRQIIELMGGAITVTSEEGRGSTFRARVELPLATTVCEGAEQAAPTALERPLRVLMADDHHANRRLVEALLTPLGFSLDTVENGEAAVRAAANGDYDLILMDMHMPVMDGLAATRAIRDSNTHNARTPIFALTANILPEQVQLCLDAGMQGHLAKPLDFEVLIGLIQDISRAEFKLVTAA